jgi:hypothetical protein
MVLLNKPVGMKINRRIRNRSRSGKQLRNIFRSRDHFLQFCVELEFSGRLVCRSTASPPPAADPDERPVSQLALLGLEESATFRPEVFLVLMRRVLFLKRSESWFGSLR